MLSVAAVEVVADAAQVARRCDAIWVCTPTSAHRGAVDAALAAGCAVFCEKPLDVDLTRATGLVEAVGASGAAEPERPRPAQCAGLPDAP